MDNVTKIALSITTIALVATLVANGAQTASVISATGGAFSHALQSARG